MNSDIPLSKMASRCHNGITAWLVLAVLLVVTLLSCWLTNDHVHKHASDRFEFEVQQDSRAILKRMQGYEQVLRGGVGLFLASDEVTRKDWQAYVSNLQIEADWPGIQGIGYADMVAAVDRDAYITSVRREGFPDFTIRPQGARQQYSSITYLEPFNARNRRAFGYDMFADPIRRAAMIQARDSGKPAVSGKVKLVQENGEDVQAGFLMYLPRYRNGASVQTEEQRRAALLGYVYSPFRAKDLMQGIFGSEASALVNFRIYDGTTSSADSLLYSSADEMDSAAVRPQFSSTQQIKLPGHIWTVRFDSSHAFEEEAKSIQPLLVGIAGLVVDALIFAIIWSHTYNYRRAVKYAKEKELLINRLEAAASAGIVGIWEWDIAKSMLLWDKVMYQLYGLESQQGGNAYEAWLKALHPEDRLRIQREIQDALHGEREYAAEFRVIWPDGSVHYLKSVSRTTLDEQGKPVRMVGVNYDLTEQKQIQHELDSLAFYDQMTTLPNRRLLEDRLDQAIFHAKRDNHKLSLLFIDLDKFKQINDEQGHKVGDWLLKQAAERIQGCIRASDTAARIGGDEFVVLLPEVGEEGVRVAEKIRAALDQPFVMEGGMVLDISSSIGMAVYPDHADNEHDLMLCGDAAMYKAKNSGRNLVVIFAEKKA
ncbi:MAG: GGDEF domain-containing protein [Gallionella sp.]|nr:GGDEF domain-containing protein [Gallionella sp.]MDD4945274.1 GGDEF domain-containing protein [Gallionella sp.]MDD5612180.1 GGDEF domain-containing protein [Gallionella sp.]